MLSASVPPCSSIDQAAALRVFAFTCRDICLMGAGAGVGVGAGATSCTTSPSGAVFPLKYSAADRAGSADSEGRRYRPGVSPTVGVQ